VEERLGFESIVPSALNLGTESLFHFLSGVGGPGGWLDFGRGGRIFFFLDFCSREGNPRTRTRLSPISVVLDRTGIREIFACSACINMCFIRA
jgi:hypothetical protein